jgi:hypothetical protein
MKIILFSPRKSSTIRYLSILGSVMNSETSEEILHFFFFFDNGEPLQGRALWTHPYRVNLGPMHRTHGNFPTWNRVSHWLHQGVWPQGEMTLMGFETETLRSKLKVPAGTNQLSHPLGFIVTLICSFSFSFFFFFLINLFQF